MSRLEPVKSVNLEEVGHQQPRQPLLAQPQPEPEPIGQAFATDLLLKALAALSQRFVVALSQLFTLLTVASVFYLFVVALGEPSILKLVGLALYCTFVLLINVYGRRRS